MQSHTDLKKLLLSALLFFAGIAIANAQDGSAASEKTSGGFFAGGGIGVSVRPFMKAAGPAAELYGGKWFNKSVGLRGRVNGMYLPSGNGYASAFASVDFLWSFLAGVERKVWTPVLSPFLGWWATPDDDERGLCLGLNLIDEFRLNSHLSLALNATLMSGFDIHNQGMVPFFTTPTPIITVGANYYF